MGPLGGPTSRLARALAISEVQVQPPQPRQGRQGVQRHCSLRCMVHTQTGECRQLLECGCEATSFQSFSLHKI